jgi:hypothetical protein
MPARKATWARLADLDGDGQAEILSIAWDTYPYLRLWHKLR